MQRIYILIAILLTASPTSAQLSVRGDLARDHDAAPNTTARGEIVIENKTTEAKEVRVYQTDYLFFADGTNRYGPAGESDRSNAGWVTFSPAQFTIMPGGTVSVFYMISIPEAEPGSYWSMLMVEDLRKADHSSPAREDIAVGFRQVTRYGIQLATHVSESEGYPTFSNPSLGRDERDRTHFSVDVGNEGAKMMRAEMYLRLFSPDGSEFGPFTGARYRIYPETSVRQRIVIDGVPPGTYQALMVVDAGNDAVFGIQYDLSL